MQSENLGVFLMIMNVNSLKMMLQYQITSPCTVLSSPWGILQDIGGCYFWQIRGCWFKERWINRQLHRVNHSQSRSFSSSFFIIDQYMPSTKTVRALYCHPCFLIFVIFQYLFTGLTGAGGHKCLNLWLIKTKLVFAASGIV